MIVWVGAAASDVVVGVSGVLGRGWSSARPLVWHGKQLDIDDALWELVVDTCDTLRFRGLLRTGDRTDQVVEMFYTPLRPAGVFTVNTKNRPDAQVKVTARAVYVGGHATDYVAKSRHKAQRAARLLHAALGHAVPVHPG